MKFRPITLSLLVLASVAGSWLAAGSGSGNAQATTNGSSSCPSGVGVTKPFGGETVSGIVTLEATVPSSYNAQGVKFIVKDQFYYGGVKTDPYWRASFDSRNADLGGNGSYTVRAKIALNPSTGSGSNTSGSSYVCETPPLSFNVNNPPATVSTAPKSLEVFSSLSSWTGPTNVLFDVVLQAVLVSGGNRSDVSQQAAYDWSVSRGVLTPKGNRATINSGPSAGEGAVKVRVRYGEQEKELVIPMKVQSASQPTTYPVVAADESEPNKPESAPAPAERPATIEEAQEEGLFQTALSRKGQGDAELDRCLSHALGEAVYHSRLKQQPRLGFNELEKSEQCFIRRSSVVPANLAPVEPSKVRSLPVKKEVKLEKFQKISKNGKDAIEISGRAKPNQTVLVYVFSEPLVLVAKADNEGRWTYVLEDPMEPGDHESFVTVEGDGADQPIVRSAGFGFAIAAAPKTKLNPLGLGFSVETNDKSKLFYSAYVAAAVAVVAVALFLTLWYVRHRHPDTKTVPVGGAAGAGTVTDASDDPKPPAGV